MVWKCKPENAMNNLVFAIALSLIVPAIHAQQTDTSGNLPQTAPQATPQPAALVCTRAANGAQRTLKTKRAAIRFMKISCSEVTQREKYSNRSMRSNDSN